MKKPVFNHSSTVFTLSWILTLPILIDICTGCTLFSFWIVWFFYLAVLVISIIRLAHGFRQKCYKFCWGLIAQLVLGAGILLFFQLSFNDVIQTAVSHPVMSYTLDVKNPITESDSARTQGAYCPRDSDVMIVPSVKKSSVESHKASHSLPDSLGKDKKEKKHSVTQDAKEKKEKIKALKSK